LKRFSGSLSAEVWPYVAYSCYLEGLVSALQRKEKSNDPVVWVIVDLFIPASLYRKHRLTITMAYNVSAELFAEWAIGLVIIAVRLYARWKVGKGKFYWDDLCLVLATVSACAYRPR
jgi:hypothetical protein